MARPWVCISLLGCMGSLMLVWEPLPCVSGVHLGCSDCPAPTLSPEAGTCRASEPVALTRASEAVGLHGGPCKARALQGWVARAHVCQQATVKLAVCSVMGAAHCWQHAYAWGVVSEAAALAVAASQHAVQTQRQQRKCWVHVGIRASCTSWEWSLARFGC